jgi:hypothetical protein
MMPWRKISILLILGLLVLFTTAFVNNATIENSGTNRYKAVRLTPEIYNNANSDLSDLRIIDSNVEFVPYFIHSRHQEEQRETVRYSMSLINSYLRDDNFYFDYNLSERFDRDVVATSLEFTTNNSTFAKNVEVFGSYDNIHWEFVQRDQLYRVGNNSKLEIIFNAPQRFTHYRLRLNNNLEQISFSAVNLTYSATSTQRHYFVEDLFPKFDIEEDGRLTHIHIEGLKNLRLGEIIIDTNSMFQRTVEAPSFGIRKELYNLSFDDIVYNDTLMTFNQSISRNDIFSLVIHNGDDRPINITGITVRYYADDIIFESQGDDTFALSFGSDNGLRAPVYDIVRYKDEILRLDIDRLEISRLTFEEIEPTPEPRDYRMVFNIVVVAVTVLLGVLILLKLKKSSEASR